MPFSPSHFGLKSITHTHLHPQQVQVAETDARLDLSLPAGKHEALVYVWCVFTIMMYRALGYVCGHTHTFTPSTAMPQTPLTGPHPTTPKYTQYRKVVPGQPLVEPWSYEETFRPHLAEYLETSRAFRGSLTHIPRG